MSNFYHAYALTRPWDFRDLASLNDPDIVFEVVKAGSPRQSFVYALKTPAQFCSGNGLQFVAVKRSFLAYLPGGQYGGARVEEGLLLLTPRDYGSALCPIPSRAKLANEILGKAFDCQPITNPTFYGCPVDMAGDVNGKPWHLWRYR